MLRSSRNPPWGIRERSKLESLGSHISFMRGSSMIFWFARSRASFDPKTTKANMTVSFSLAPVRSRNERTYFILRSSPIHSQYLSAPQSFQTWAANFAMLSYLSRRSLARGRTNPSMWRFNQRRLVKSWAMEEYSSREFRR